MFSPSDEWINITSIWESKYGCNIEYLMSVFTRLDRRRKYEKYVYYEWRNAVAQLVEALRCNSESRGFDSRWRLRHCAAIRKVAGSIPDGGWCTALQFGKSRVRFQMAVEALRYNSESRGFDSRWRLMHCSAIRVRFPMAVEALRCNSESRGFDSRWRHNPSGRTVAMGSTQPLTEMSTRNTSLG